MGHQQSHPCSATWLAQRVTNSLMKASPQHRIHDTDTALHKASRGSTVTYWPGLSLVLGHYKPQQQQQHPKNTTPLHGSVSLRQRHSLGVTPAPTRDYDYSPGHAAKTRTPGHTVNTNTARYSFTSQLGHSVQESLCRHPPPGLYG